MPIRNRRVFVSFDNDRALHNFIVGQGIAIAPREGDKALEMRTLARTCSVSGQHLHLQEGVEYGPRSSWLALPLTSSSQVSPAVG